MTYKGDVTESEYVLIELNDSSPYLCDGKIKTSFSYEVEPLNSLRIHCKSGKKYVYCKVIGVLVEEPVEPVPPTEWVYTPFKY